jgi:hypothetical protein
VQLKIARKDIEAAQRFVEGFHDRHEPVKCDEPVNMS